jgi:putative PIG3 family NAD(P)H quinone oxidoreductase
MRAVAIDRPGPANVLQLVDVPVPEPRDGEVLVRVAAAGVNRPDVLQRQGKYPLPPDADPLPGLEIAGHVVAAGSDAGHIAVGDRVMALAHGGGYAEYCRVPASHCLPVPSTLSLTEAAAIPETYFTVWYNVFRRAALKAGETLLVHGGSSGIGTTAIQLAVARGSRVITTAGSDEKCRFCESLGAEAINYRRDDWPASVVQRTDERGVDVVLDMVAGSYLQKNIDVLARDGRYAIIAFLQGPVAELNLRRIVTHRLTVTGSTLRPQSVAEKAGIAAELAAEVLPLLESGAIRPIVYKIFPLADVRDAHLLMESSAHMGKLVLDMTT